MSTLTRLRDGRSYEVEIPRRAARAMRRLTRTSKRSRPHTKRGRALRRRLHRMAAGAVRAFPARELFRLSLLDGMPPTRADSAWAYTDGPWRPFVATIGPEIAVPIVPGHEYDVYSNGEVVPRRLP